MKPSDTPQMKILCVILLLWVLMQQSNQQQQISNLTIHLGRSYHILYGNPKPETGVDSGIYQSVFNYTYSKSKTTQDGKYYIPDEVIVYKISTCSLTPKVSVYRGTQSYQQDLKTITQISSGSNGLNSYIFSMSSGMNKTYNLTSVQKMALTHATAECPFYGLSFDEFATLNLGNNFKSAALQAFTQNNWTNFIATFGTHYISEVIMGGRVIQQITYTFENQSKLQSVDIDLRIAARGSFAKFFNDSSFDLSKIIRSTNYGQKFRTSKSQFYMGASPPQTGVISDWLTQVGNNLVPINLKLAPLSDLFSKISDTQFNQSLAVIQLQSAISNECTRLNCRNFTLDYLKPGPASLTTQTSTIYGVNTGTIYNDYVSSTTMELKKVIARFGTLLDSIKLYFSDGVSEYNTSTVGGGGGSENIFNVPDGEYINQIQIRAGNKIDAVEFLTDKGTRSPHMGGYGGILNIVTVPQDYRIAGFSGTYSTTVYKMSFYFVKVVYPSLITSESIQVNFNYVGNGDYKKNSCSNITLATIYSCTLSFDGHQLYCPGTCPAINLENQSQFQTTMISIVVATLDYLSSGLYYQRGFKHSLYPIYGGTYKLSFSAMTRKTGTPSSFSFSVSLLSANSTTTYFTKTYTFSSLGTMNVTETITISTLSDSGLVYLYFDAGTNSSQTPVGAGITNVRFQKVTCYNNETATLLASGEIACILTKTIESMNYCSKFTYEHYNSAGLNPITKGFSCTTCYSSYKLVGMYDSSYETFFNVWSHHVYGCTINEIPNTSWYNKLNVKDADGKYYYSTRSCTGTGYNFLIVPGISSSTYDASQQYCNATADSTVSWWEVVNAFYLPAKCSTAGYYPVIVNSTSRTCQSVSSLIPDCAIYNVNLTCYSCLGNTSLVTWNNAGTIKNLCLISSQILHCNNFTSVSQAYVCSSCDSGYTLSSQKYCVRNDMFDGNCTSFALNAKNYYECIACGTDYTLSYVELEFGPVKKCLSTVSEVIRDCSAYKYIPGGIQCYKCSNASTSIDRYSFIYNSMTGYRCLNTLTEYISNCTTYNYAGSKYTCTFCIAGYEVHNVSINSAIKLRCLSISSQIVSQCSVYSINASNNYTCDQCMPSYTVKTVSGTNRCLPNSVIDTQCTTYILNGSNYECSQCNSDYTVKTVSGTNRCLPNSVIDTQCTTYILNGSNYECSQCNSDYTVKTVSGTNRCLPNSVIDTQCTTYILNGSNYECSQCNSDYTVKTVSGTNRCLPNSVIDTQCTTYILNGSNYECSQCNSDYTVKTVSGTNRCLPNSVIDTQCTTYILNGSNYECSQCNSDYTVKTVSGTNRCLPNSVIDTQCTTYILNGSNYECSQCNSDYTVKTVSGTNRCLPNSVIDTQCTTYILNGSNYECSQCNSDYTVKTVSGTNRCLPNSVIDTQCTTYILNGSNYECSQCNSDYTVKTVSGTNRCLPNSVIDTQCTTYILNGSNYECSQCNSDYTVKTVSGTNRCLPNSVIDTQCTTYILNGSNYECSQCNSDYTVKTVSGTNRCLPNSVIDTQCTTYILNGSNYECSQCNSDYTVKTVSGTNRCLPNSVIDTQCTTYILNGSNYECSQCNSDYTVKTVSGTNRCLPNSVIDTQCTTYILNGSNYECSQCSSLYSLVDVYTASAVLKKCLSISSQIIRDCSVYEVISGGFQCHTCSTLTSIAKYSFTLNGVNAYRCLNSVSEHVDLCTTYKFQNQIYECTLCDSDHLKSNVKISGVERIRCLSKSTDIVQDCQHYNFDSLSSKYLCDQCNSQFSLQPNNICVHNADIEDDCIEYQDNGSNQICKKCSTDFTLSNVSVNNLIDVRCLSSNHEVIRGCTKYEYFSNSYQCVECDASADYSSETVIVNSIEKLRCLVSSQVVQNCLNYIVQNQGNYLCNQCENDFTLSVGVGHKVCVSDENIQSHCIQYEDHGTVEQCIRCQQSFILSTVTSLAQSVKKCISTSQVVKYCQTYLSSSSGTLTCLSCYLGSTKSTVIINSQISIRCLLNSLQLINECETYTVNNHDRYDCIDCQNLFQLRDGLKNKICVSTNNLQENCLTYKDKGLIQQCTKCELDFSLLNIISSGNQRKKCLNRTNLLNGCQDYEFDANNKLVCIGCDSLHSLQSIRITDTKYENKCISIEDVVPHCLSYIHVGLSCAYDCYSCSSQFQLSNVKINHRISKGCLDKTTEYLPFCNRHSKLETDGIYYCRNGICSGNSFSIPIGPNSFQLACATNQLISTVEVQNCQYFERPRLGITQITCSKCKSGFVQPYCESSSYNGLTNGP